MELLREAIEHGSVFNVIKEGKVSTSDILETILKFPKLDDPRLTRAYRAACTLENPDKHYLKGIHFLSRVSDYPDYGAIFLASNGNIEAPIEYGSTQSNKIVSVITRSVMKFHTDGEFRRRIMISCGKDPQQDNGVSSCYQLDDIKLAIQFRSPMVKTFMVASSFRDNSLGSIVVENDAFEYFDAQRSTIMLSQLITRCIYLKTNTKMYWEKVTPEYKRFVEKRLNGNSRSLTRDGLRELHSIFPTLVDERLLTFSELAFHIYFLDLLQRAYILGYPIHTGLPKETDVMKALNNLSEWGIEKYVASIADYNRGRLKLVLPGTFGGEELEPEKDTNVMEMSIYEYNLFDTIAYNDNGHYYVFTRLEFPSLLKEKKHLYTRTILPANIILDINQRLKFASDMKLPKCETIGELLEKMESKINKEVNASVLLPPIPTRVVPRIASSLYDSTDARITRFERNTIEHLRNYESRRFTDSIAHV